jgi:hypothetical protein
MTNISIGGNVTDSVLVYGNDNFVVKIGDVNGGVVNIIKPSDKQKYSARPTPVVMKPRTFRALLDRENESKSVRKAAQLATSVSVWGQEGVGKTSFMRHLAHTLDVGGFTSGLVYFNASGLGYEDLLQGLFDLFFDSDPSYKPTTANITRALQNIKALIFLDDIKISRDEAASVLDAAPNSLFILASTERALWGEGEIVPLRGLPESQSLQLFQKELSRPLNDEEKEIVIKICAVLQGHPLQILQAAAIARDGGRAVEDLLLEITSEKTENKSKTYVDMADLGDSERQVLAILAAAGGNIVSLEHIKGILKDTDAQNNVQRLVTLGLVQAHSPRFSITDALVSSISATWDISSWQDALLTYAINWLGQQPAFTVVEESSGLLLHTIKSAGGRKKWREVIQLGLALEKYLVFYKRWQQWSDVLNLILMAAKALNDSKMQAWALHQLGSRALYLGYAGEAKTLLSQALNIRQAIGDKAGLAVTQHNINILNGIIAPVQGKSSGCGKYVVCGILAVVGLVTLALVALIAYRFTHSNNTLPLEPVTIQSSDTFVPTETPLPSPSLTAQPTQTPRPTSTRVPTNTPFPTRTPVPTDTSIPVLIFDFVDQANEAFPYYSVNSPENEISQNNAFFIVTESPSPEDYMNQYGVPYFGWDYDVPLMNGRTYKKVLLTYPYYEYYKVYGDFRLNFVQPAPDAYLELVAGYKNVTIESVEGFIFRLYVNGEPVIEEPYNFGDDPINIGRHIPLSGGSNTFRLEVESMGGYGSPYDFATWAVVKLWDKKP